MSSKAVLALLPLLASGALAIDTSIPANVKTFYNQVVAQKKCNNQLASGLYSYYGGKPDWSYCGDHLTDYGVMYTQGPKGLLTNMDIDCDGIQLTPNDGRCGHNPTDQNVTAFRDIITTYNIPNLADLDPYRHPYIVFGNSGSKPGDVDFAPQDYGIEPLSVVAVVTPTKMVCGIWGDLNGGERTSSYVGEAALAMGELCFGNAVNGSTSHDPNDVLYITFAGQQAVPGKNGANWSAKTKEDFVSSIDGLCRTLVQRIGGDTWNATSAGCDSGCGWVGHCDGDKCSKDTDCWSSMVCKSGKCTESCDWDGHCAGSCCSSDGDCAGDLSCQDGKCA